MDTNTKARQQAISTAAAQLIDRNAIANAAPPIAKAMRLVAQAELMRLTGCDLKTARKHIKQAIGEQ